MVLNRLYNGPEVVKQTGWVQCIQETVWLKEMRNTSVCVLNESSKPGMCSLGHAKDLFIYLFFKLLESKNVRFLFTPLSTVRCLMNTTLVFLPTSWDWVLHCWVWGLYSDTSQECSPGGSNLQCDQSFDRTGSNMCVDWSVSSAGLYSATNLHACVTWTFYLGAPLHLEKLRILDLILQIFFIVLLLFFQLGHKNSS